MQAHKHAERERDTHLLKVSQPNAESATALHATPDTTSSRLQALRRVSGVPRSCRLRAAAKSGSHALTTFVNDTEPLQGRGG